MTHDWQRLTAMSAGEPFLIERVRLTDSDVAIEGRFELPPLAKLAAEDQVFVAAFVRAHGSIKRMEELFGISYPTIKNRLKRLSRDLDFIEVLHLDSDTDEPPRAARPSGRVAAMLAAIEDGTLSGAEALRRLSGEAEAESADAAETEADGTEGAES